MRRQQATFSAHIIIKGAAALAAAAVAVAATLVLITIIVMVEGDRTRPGSPYGVRQERAMRLR